MTRIRLIATALLSMIASTAWADLRTFDVPPEYRQELFSALQRVLFPQGQPTQANVQLLPSGQILVNASPESLQQIEAVLQTIRAQPTEPAPRAALRYWAVLGSRNGVADPPGTPPPAVLGDVLGELGRIHGDLTFRVLGTAALVTDSGQEGSVDGMPLDVEQEAIVQGDKLNAEIHLHLTGIGGPDEDIALLRIGSLSVRTSLNRGEFVVLGESEHQGQGTGIDGLVFYIVHWAEE